MTASTFEERYGITPWEPQHMTICIAAICERGKAIVSVCDREFGVGFTSAETTEQKLHPLFPGKNEGQWMVALAGTVGNAVEVIGEVRRIEPTMQSREWYDMQAALEKAYRRVRLSKAEGMVLAPRGWTLDAFHKSGVDRLPPSTYASLDAQLAMYDLGASLIVSGFAQDGFPCILTVGNPGVAQEHTKIGFWCIGSGATLAQASLFNREYSAALSIEQAAYAVYEAKRNSERATGVGNRQTDLLIVTKNRVGLLPAEALKLLSADYDKLRPKEFDLEMEKAMRLSPTFADIRKSL